MVQQAVGGDAEAPLISPTEATEDELWDSLEYEDSGEASPGGEPPEPGADDEATDEDGGESGDESADEHPADDSREAAVQQREAWVRAVALDPSAIQQVPRRQRKAILAAAEVVKPAAWNIAQPYIAQETERRTWQAVQMLDKTQELDALSEDDPQTLIEVLKNPGKHGFTDEIVSLWRKIQDWRETGGPAGTPPQSNGAQPQQQRQPQVDPTVGRWQTRATAAIDEYADEFGEDAVRDVVAWLQEEGLTAVRTGQEAESGYKALKAHLDAERAKRRGGPPPAVQRRRTLARPDVSPGSVAVGGRVSREEAHRRAFGGSESDAWASL